MTKFTVKASKNKQVIDVTDKINEILAKLKAKSGICHVFVTHTTCCLTTADLDPGTDEDLLDALEKMFPKGNYRHPHNPGHVGEHIMSSIIGASLSLPVENGALILGTWQRVVLVELSGPRERNLIVEFITS
jgi:secondary thiamine-phosphate synthase enzyme